MHDPLTVAFEIRRPWPTKSLLPAVGRSAVRWRIRLHHDCGAWCTDDPPHRTGAFPWWQPSSFSAFWRLAGRDYYFPPVITVWHREPGNRDGLTICGKRTQRPDGTWKFSRSWRFHVHHWRLQVPPAQELRRRLLTRCTVCSGRSTRQHPVNVARSWGRNRGPWWRGETGLTHMTCPTSVKEHGHA